MLVGHGSAWMEIGKTLNALGFGGGGYTIDFSGFALPNVDQIKKNAEVALNNNIAAAQQTTMMDPIAQAQQVSSPAIVDTGLARTPQGEIVRWWCALLLFGNCFLAHFFFFQPKLFFFIQIL